MVGSITESNVLITQVAVEQHHVNVSKLIVAVQILFLNPAGSPFQPAERIYTKHGSRIPQEKNKSRNDFMWTLLMYMASSTPLRRRGVKKKKCEAIPRRKSAAVQQATALPFFVGSGRGGMRNKNLNGIQMLLNLIVRAQAT